MLRLMTNIDKRGVGMRIVAGKFGGRKLKGVVGKKTRPTSDKVKEAVFQMIGPFFQSGSCLDLFAGSGALGLEALSRGMEQAYFVDKQRNAVEIINENINMLQLENQTEVFRMSAHQAIRLIAKDNEQFNLIFIDPPYKTIDFEKNFNLIIENNLLKNNGMIYCEHDPSEVLPEDYLDLQLVKRVNYGQATSVTLYRFSTK